MGRGKSAVLFGVAFLITGCLASLPLIRKEIRLQPTPTAAVQAAAVVITPAPLLHVYLPDIPQVFQAVDHWRPATGTSWQIQFSGPLDLSLPVQLYDLDLFDTPPETISNLKAQGRRVVCYFNAGAWEEWRSDAAQFPEDVVGKELEGWPGERWLDIRSEVVRSIMQARLDLAVQKGCDGVDPDNVDGYTQDSGFDLTAQDQLDYNRWLAQAAHQRGLGIGLKNDLDQVDELLSAFDWALNEQCFQYNECERLLPFVQAGKPVFGIEYEGDPDVFCPQANSMGMDWLKKNRELDAWRIPCR